MSCDENNDNKRLKTSLDNFLDTHESFILENDKVICKYCTKGYTFDPRRGTVNLEDHIKTEKHNSIRSIVLKNEEEKLKYGINTKNTHIKLLQMLLESNIAFNCVEKPAFKAFCESLGLVCKSSDYYNTTLLDELADQEREILNKRFTDEDIVMKFDESTDSVGRKILNVHLSELTSEKYIKPILFFSVEVLNTKASTIAIVLNDMLKTIMPLTSQRHHLKVILSDGASYCAKIAEILKTRYTSAFYIKCLCHNLHNLAETCRNHFVLINLIITAINKKLKNGSKLSDMWKNIFLFLLFLNMLVPDGVLGS